MFPDAIIPRHDFPYATHAHSSHSQ